MANRFPPLFSTPMISAPQAAPIALPRAPERLAPPMTQAAMACSSKPVPAGGDACAEARRQQHPADGGEHAGDHVHRRGDHGYWDTGESSRLGVGAHRVHVPRGSPYSASRRDRLAARSDSV